MEGPLVPPVRDVQRRNSPLGFDEAHTGTQGKVLLGHHLVRRSSLEGGSGQLSHVLLRGQVTLWFMSVSQNPWVTLAWEVPGLGAPDHTELKSKRG